MANIADIFKAYDIRGRVGTELTADVARRVGEALGVWLPEEGPVAVGRDMRPDSAELASALIEGLRTQGRDVWDIGEVTSDMIYFAVGNFGLAGGAMITASHNPGEYNGIKFCREQAKAVGSDSGLFEIRDLADKNDFTVAASQGNVTEKDIVEDWVQHVLSFIDTTTLQPLRLAVDAGNGMAGKIFPELEPYVPFEVEELYFELDGSFPNHIANPLEPKNLVDLQKTIAAQKSDVGVAFDGDGDRAVLLDEKGEPLSGTVLTAILADYMLQQHPGSTILYNAICGQAVVDTINKHGGTGIRTRVGHSFIKAKMLEHSALMGGEHSGHYFFKDNYNADSGLIAVVIALSVISQSKKPVSEIAKPYRDAYQQITETNFEVEDKEGTLKRISEAFEGSEQDWLDGLTVQVPGGWFNVRPSNTEPLLRLNAENNSKADLDKVVAQVKALIGK